MKCPACFARLPAHPQKAVCVGPCEPKPLGDASLIRGFEVRSKPIIDVAASPARDLAAAPVTCSNCSVRTTVEACPYCSFPIPPNWRAAKVTCIAMAGARATGKSMMLAVAKEQMELFAQRHHHSTFRGLGETEKTFNRNYTVPLYEERRLLQATTGPAARDSVTRDPLIFTFTEKLADGTAQVRLLVLRDVAGEELESIDAANHHLAFFSRADAIITLIDPLTVREVQDMLTGLVPRNDRFSGEGESVLHHVLTLMTNRIAGARTNIPLGVVLSKVDVLQRLRDVTGTNWSRIMNRPGSPLQRDPSLMAAEFDAVQGDLLHEEVGGLLDMLHAGAIKAMISETADHFRFFAVSALGASPEGDMIHQGGIAPFRVLDPFMWAMRAAG